MLLLTLSGIDDLDFDLDLEDLEWAVSRVMGFGRLMQEREVRELFGVWAEIQEPIVVFWWGF